MERPWQFIIYSVIRPNGVSFILFSHFEHCYFSTSAKIHSQKKQAGTEYCETSNGLKLFRFVYFCIYLIYSEVKHVIFCNLFIKSFDNKNYRIFIKVGSLSIMTIKEFNTCITIGKNTFVSLNYFIWESDI